MPFTKVQDPSGATVYEQTPNGGNEEFIVRFADGSDAAIGEGVTDTDITYLRLRNASGASAYIYPNAARNGITVSANRP